jgi:hypothetical protein
MADGPVSGITVKKASYGVSPSSLVDVTQQTQSLIRDDALNFTVSPQAFGVLDPAPGVKKVFQAYISMNGKSEKLITKNDGEVIDLDSTKTVKKDTPNHLGALGTSLFYFSISLTGVYLAYSFYLLMVAGKMPAFGYLLGALILGAFASYGASDTGSGVLAFIFGTPVLLLNLLILVFLLLCYDPNWIDFSYIQKAVVEVPS